MAGTRRDSESGVVSAAVALGLAVCAALSFAVGDAIGFVSPSTEAMFTLLWMVGWALLAWAMIIGAVVSVHLVRKGAFLRRPVLREAVLIIATAAVIAGVIFAHPLVGSGAGTG